MTRHKIVLVPFPFDDFSATKVRPAVCLTDPVGAQRHVIIAFITSRVPHDLLDSDLVIPANHPEFPSCGLRVASTVRLHRMMTVSVRLIVRELGILPKILQMDVHQRIGRMFPAP
jgi:mRNA interferase MazF